MAAYADYSYYRDDYRGQMGEDDFARLSIRATAYLDAVTFRRIRGAWTEDAAVRDACCAVADAFHRNEQGGGIASETNDGISVNYVAGVSKAKTDNERLWEAAVLHLGCTGLLYRGVP